MAHYYADVTENGPLPPGEHYTRSMRLLSQAELEESLPALLASAVHMLAYVGRHLEQADDEVEDRAAMVRNALVHGERPML